MVNCNFLGNAIGAELKIGLIHVEKCIFKKWHLLLLFKILLIGFTNIILKLRIFVIIYTFLFKLKNEGIH